MYSYIELRSINFVLTLSKPLNHGSSNEWLRTSIYHSQSKAWLSNFAKNVSWFLLAVRTVKLQIRLASTNNFFQFFWARSCNFLSFNAMKNCEIIWNSGIIGGQVLLEVLRYVLTKKCLVLWSVYRVSTIGIWCSYFIRKTCWGCAYFMQNKRGSMDFWALLL